MGRRSSSGAACLVLVLAAVTAGCGGGGQKKAGPTAIATRTAAPASGQHTTEQATATPATAEPVKPVGDISKLASPGNCKEFGELSIRFANALGGAASAQDLRTEAQLLEKFAAGTPSEIRADFEYVAGYFSKMAAAVSDVQQGQEPSPDTVAKLQELANALDQIRFEHVGEWLGRQCSS